MKRKRTPLVALARSARAARSEAVEFLSSAPAAKEWETVRLLGGYQLHAQATGDPDRAMTLLLGGMGYDRPYPVSWPAIGELVVGDEARHLAEADLYVVTPQMLDVVIAAAATLTLDDLALLDADDLPSRTGLLVLPRPVIKRTAHGTLTDVAGFCWRTPAVSRLPAPNPDYSAGAGTRRAFPRGRRMAWRGRRSTDDSPSSRG